MPAIIIEESIFKNIGGTLGILVSKDGQTEDRRFERFIAYGLLMKEYRDRIHKSDYILSEMAITESLFAIPYKETEYSNTDTNMFIKSLLAIENNYLYNPNDPTVMLGHCKDFIRIELPRRIDEDLLLDSLKDTKVHFIFCANSNDRPNKFSEEFYSGLKGNFYFFKADEDLSIREDIVFNFTKDLIGVDNKKALTDYIKENGHFYNGINILRETAKHALDSKRKEIETNPNLYKKLKRVHDHYQDRMYVLACCDYLLPKLMGIDLDLSDSRKYDYEKWKGKNHLGALLTELINTYIK